MSRNRDNSYAVTGPGGLDLVLYDGVGAAISRALTAALNPRSSEEASYYVRALPSEDVAARLDRDTNGDVRVYAYQPTR